MHLKELLAMIKFLPHYPQLHAVEPGLWLRSPGFHARTLAHLSESWLRDHFINAFAKTMCVVCLLSVRHQNQYRRRYTQEWHSLSLQSS